MLDTVLFQNKPGGYGFLWSEKILNQIFKGFPKTLSLLLFSDVAVNDIPWVPEDIFFLSILMVRGEAALTPRRKK